MMSMTMDEKMIEDCREQIGNREFVKCEQMLRKAMEEEPHSAVPHNLMGILLEKKGEHSLAMEHFLPVRLQGLIWNSFLRWRTLQ